MIDGELAAAAEQVAERALTLGRFEDIGLFDLDPWQLPALGAERVKLVSHGALLDEQRLAGVKPLFARNDSMVHGQSPSVIGQMRAHRRPEASFSQGDKWKRVSDSAATPCGG
jgi:hypothetical protein